MEIQRIRVGDQVTCRILKVEGQVIGLDKGCCVIRTNDIHQEVYVNPEYVRKISEDFSGVCVGVFVF